MSIQNQLEQELFKQGDEVSRNNIERIVSSYRHPWDIYTELLQNSADAIIEQFGEANINQGLVSLSVDTNERKITITDNGIGIAESDMTKILVTGQSLKRERNKSKYGSSKYRMIKSAYVFCYKAFRVRRVAKLYLITHF